MSARCEYSIKYKPLVEARRSQMDENAFQNWVNDTFTNPDLAFAAIDSGISSLSDIKVDAINLEQSPQKVDSIKSYFVNNSTGYNKCVKDFVDTVIESTIYNKNSNTWIDANNKIGSFDALNVNLFLYKIKLINRINRALSPASPPIYINPEDSNADEQLNIALSNALNSVDKYTDPIDSKVYEAYVILKNFNKLIEEKVPYIKLRKEYENTNYHGVNMYVYTGPNVKHRVSFTTNEHISATSQYSDLAITLLDYLPEYNNEVPIPDTSIGRDGFTSIMNKFKTALFYSSDPEMIKARTDYFNGDFNIQEALYSYLNLVKKWTSLSKYKNQSQITTQLTKLQGIIHIFNSNLSQDVKEMFIGMFEKTVPLSYMTYTWKNGEFGAVNLIDSYISTQQLNLQDIVNGRVYQFRKNPGQFDKLCENWGITVDLKEDIITIRPKNRNVDICISGLTGETGTYTEFKPRLLGQTISEEDLGDLIADVFGLFLPINYYTEASTYVNINGSLLNDFLPILTMALVASDKNTVPGYGFTPLTNRNILNFRSLYLYKNLEDAARTMSVLYGAETRNVVNDINGNHLPTNGLTALIFNSPRLAAEMGKSTDGYEDPFEWNPMVLHKDIKTGLYEDTPYFLSPIVRQGVKIGGKTKAVPTLELGELLEISTIYDFYDAINKGDVIYLQNANLADKERQFLIPYLLKPITIEGKTYKMSELLKQVINGDKNAINNLIELWQQLRNHRYTAIANNIVQDYNEVYSKNFKTLSDVDAFLLSKKVNVSQIRADFRSKGVNFKEEIHATATNKIARVNEVLLHFLDTFKDTKNAERRFQRSRAYFANDLFKTRTKINRYTNDVINKKWNSIDSEWKEKRGNVETGNLILFKVKDAAGNLVSINASNSNLITNPKYTVILNPILDAYLLSDIIYSHEYNVMHVGDVFSHPTKNKSGSTENNGWGSSEYYETSEASRLVAQNKRAVIYGGAIHSFQHNLTGNRGVAKNINISIMEDIPAYVWNMIGGLSNDSIDDEIDSMDGSGFQSIFEAILEQESLKDAAAGLDEKTILGWNDKNYGRQVLLKWAVYALTNERRRLSRTSNVSAEKLFQKMHSKVFNKNLNMKQIWDTYIDGDSLYIKNFNSRKNYKILDVVDVTLNDNSVVQVRTCVECTESGYVNPNAKIQYLTNKNQVVDKITSKEEATYNTLYDLDQFFGGAYEQSLRDGQLQYTTRGNKFVVDIICNEDLKDYFIAYVVNKSATKVGTENLNSKDRWYDDKELDTTIMSTEYGGLQMNAEHELEDSEVREMTQMISALIEKGFSFDLVKQIYNDIGGVVLESLKTFKSAINNYKDNPDKLKTIFGKALIEAYAKGDRDTLGLAQAFLGKAERMLRENDIKFTFPFSAATINPSFISTVASLLTKRGIRRKYSGIAAVLTPSYDMIQVYGDGKTLEKHVDNIVKWQNTAEGIGFKHTTIESLIKDVYVVDDYGETKRNPFLVADTYKNFTFEDTIVIEDPNTGLLSDPIIINSYEAYDKYKHYNGKIYVFTSRPRNLRAANTTFRIGAKEYSVYDLSSTRAANYANLKITSKLQDEIIFEVLKQVGKIYQDELVWNTESPTQLDIDTLIQAINSSDKVTVQKIINLNKTLYNVVQKQLRDLSNLGVLNDVILTSGLDVHVANIKVDAAEIVMGKLFAKQFGLKVGDDVQDILSKGTNFFYDRMTKSYHMPSDITPNHYDVVAYTKDGEQLLIKIDSNLEYNFDKSLNPNITKVDGKVFLNQEELTTSENKEFYQIQSNNGKLYNVVVLKNVNDLYDFINSNQIVQHTINYDSENVIDLIRNTSDIEEYNIEINGQQYIGTYDELLNALLEGTISEDLVREILIKSEQKQYNNRLWRHAERMAESFRLSLNFVGTRIPAQAMQSFQPMKVVAFTDSETNDVYVNRHNTYLEGSDYKDSKLFKIL